jgi:hypothetical protein
MVKADRKLVSILKSHTSLDMDQFQPSDDLDYWDYNYKLHGGRLISQHLYSSRSLPSSTPHPPKTTPKPKPPRKYTPKYHPHPPSSTLTMHKRISKALWYDPDPPRQIVDVKSDSEFITAIHPRESSTFRDIENHPFGKTTQQNDSRLDIWREQIAFASHSSPAPRIPQNRLRLKTDSKEMTAIVLRGMHGQSQGLDDSSTVASVVDGSEMKKEMLMDTDGDIMNIKLYSSECNDEFIFPRQTMGLSGVFLRRMNLDGFDGDIIVEETSVVMKLLGAWLSRDLEFEITIGMLYWNPSH